LNISGPDGLAQYPSRKVMNLQSISLIIRHVPFEYSPISANVRSGATIQLPALLQWALSISNWHPIVLNRCRCRRYGCGCLCQCCGRCICRCSTIHRRSAWTIPCNAPHLMASVALQSMHPIGPVTCMHLILRTTAIALTIDITELPRVPRLLPSIALRLQLSEHGGQL
jgi:hypothetical protein